MVWIALLHGMIKNYKSKRTRIFNLRDVHARIILLSLFKLIHNLQLPEMDCQLSET